MSIDAYVDAIIDLLIEAGVPKKELDEKGTEQLLTHAFMKGRSFEDAARSACSLHGVET